MDEYMAKSNPPETLEEHTLELIKNYDILKNIYPNIEIDWFLLKKAVIYHDMGKINDKFQSKLNGGKKEKSGDEIHHGFLSIGFINYRNIFEKDCYINEKIDKYEDVRKKILASSIFFHHNRQRPTYDANELRSMIESELEIIKRKKISFNSDELKGISVEKLPSKKHFNFATLSVGDTNGSKESKNNRLIFLEYCKIKGLLNRIDYAASAHGIVEYPNDFLRNHLDGVLEKWKENNSLARWNELQNYMKKHKDDNIIAIAQTGMGKTEAGLLWIDNSKGFFTLPLKTAINSIYERIISDMQGNLSEKVGLLHSDTASRYLNLIEDEKHENLQLEDYITRTRQLSMPLTICTIDQIFDFVYKYLGCELKMATLSYSKVIIDEIQMYNPQLLAVVISALEWIVQLGGKFAILTATMPKFFIDEMKERKIPFLLPEPFLNDDIRHSIQVLEENINCEFVIDKYQDNKILVICNTVRIAQQLYIELSEIESIADDVHIFHGAFIKKDRVEREKEILEFAKSQDEGIWICTQVVEASLDIDFDILITELSDINGLFQRLGRCYRKRSFYGEGYNCYIFSGEGNKYPSGIGRVVDEDIFKLSKKAIENIDGKISEINKQNIINQVYSTGNLINTKFYEQFRGAYKYLNLLYSGEKSHKEAINEFRNINSIDVIPRCVYENNRLEIEKSIYTLGMKISDVVNIKEYTIEKIRAKEKLNSFTITIPFTEYNEIKSERIDITRNQSIIISEIDYSENFGIKRATNKKKNSPQSILDRMV